MLDTPLKYKCLKCQKEWGDLNAGDDNISHGFCRRCLRELQKDTVRRRQRNEGYSPCYAKGYEDCSEECCAFWSNCLEENIKEWERHTIYENSQGKEDISH
jgi:hypothetical protein